MASRKLAELFAALEIPTDRAALCATRLSATSNYRLARAANGDALLLLALPSGSEVANAHPIRLRHFEYEPRVVAYVRDAGTAGGCDGEFLIVRCREGDSDLRAHFFKLLEGLIDYLGESPALTKADEAVRDLVELFRAMSRPARKAIAGLWTELLVLVDAANPEFAAAAWHSDPNEQHDFASGKDRVEVKATTRPVREHDVALDQLTVPAGGDGVLVSIMLEPSDAGASTIDLLEAASERLPIGTEARRRLNTIVAETIGEEWRDAQQVRFNLVKARASRRLFDLATIPSVDQRIPAQVSRVHFSVDLSDVAPLEPAEAATRSALSGALFGIPPHR